MTIDFDSAEIRSYPCILIGSVWCNAQPKWLVSNKSEKRRKAKSDSYNEESLQLIKVLF
jgi:hypothetical protein